MNTLWKILFIVVMIGLLNQTAFAKVLEGDELRVNVVKRLPSLNHTKLQALMQRVGKKPPKNFYNCLCRQDGGGAAPGVGVSYHPEPLKPYDERYSCQHSGPPCMAAGYGCWRFPLPRDSKIWSYCIGKSKYDDNSTIIDVIVREAEKIHAEQDWNRRKIIDNISPLPNEISGDTINLARLNKLAKEKEAAALKLKKERDEIDRVNRVKLAKELKGKPHKEQLEIIFKEIIQKKLKEKYYVQDPNLVDHEKAFNLTVGRVIDPICNYKGGMCGEFSEFGKEWTQKIIDDNKLFDGKAIVDTLFIEEKSTANPNNIVDRVDRVVYADNHITTRIILPNGKRYILDYWEYMGRSKGKVNILEEKEWIRKWRKDIGITDSLVQRTFIEDELERLIADKGEDEGIKKFRILNKKNSKKEIYIKSWKKEPWGKEVDNNVEKELLEERRKELEKMEEEAKKRAIENAEMKDRLPRIYK